MNERTSPQRLLSEAGGRRSFNVEGRGRLWLQRALLAVVGVVLMGVAFFFITVALVVGALLAAAIALRVWWVMRRLRAARKAAAPLDGQYTVIEHDAKIVRK